MWEKDIEREITKIFPVVKNSTSTDIHRNAITFTFTELLIKKATPETHKCHQKEGTNCCRSTNKHS